MQVPKPVLLFDMMMAMTIMQLIVKEVCVN